MTPLQLSVLTDLLPVVERLLPTLRPVEECWQPSDLLPNTAAEDWHDEIAALRAEAALLSDELLVILVGNVVTEEALPSYQTALNRFDGLTDPTGTDPNPWARWSRGWTAEEKRHGDVTRTYLYLSGRVDLEAVERTVQHLLRNGFDTRADGCAYRGLAYASFQEHATKTSWSQLGNLVGALGAKRLHRICGLVAADEARHERVYVALLREVLLRDAEHALPAIAETLGASIVMPARTMTDGKDRHLFGRFAEVGQRTGVYTLADYAANLEQLVATLGLHDLTGLAGEASRARDLLCELPARYRALAAERAARPNRLAPFSWIHGRKA